MLIVVVAAAVLMFAAAAVTQPSASSPPRGDLQDVSTLTAMAPEGVGSWLTGAAGGDEQPDPPADSSNGDPGVTETIVAQSPGGGLTEENVRMVRPDRFDIHVKDASLTGVLTMIGSQGRKNIIATEGVEGTVTLDLYGVTFEEALEALMKQTNLIAEIDGDFVYVYTPAQYAQLSQEEEKIVTRFFRLKFLRAADAATLLDPVLSPTGTIATTPTPSGQMGYAVGDMLIVRDVESQFEQIEAMLRELDVRPPQVLIEATILQADLNEDNALGIDFTALSGVDFRELGTNASFDGVEPSTVPAADFENGMARYRTSFTSQVGSGGMDIGIIYDEIAIFLKALETVTDVMVLANPKLLVLNKHAGEVIVGREDGYLTTTFSDTVATEGVEMLKTGTRMTVTPYVLGDGYIRMDIHPEDSSGSVVQFSGAALPQKSTTEVTSSIMVRDGHTIVIGGLFRESTTTGRSQVPGIGNVPVLGPLFRSQSDTTRRQEVVILITPHVIDQGAAEVVGGNMKADVERFRVGVRKGLLWFGRQRLANEHVRWARRDLRLGRKELALWNLDRALAMQPRLAEAIDLRERLTGEAYWSSDVRTRMSRFLLERIVMTDMGKPVERVIPPHRPRKVEDMDRKAVERMGIEPRIRDDWPGFLDVDDLMVPRDADPAPSPQPDEQQEPKDAKFDRNDEAAIRPEPTDVEVDEAEDDGEGFDEFGDEHAASAADQAGESWTEDLLAEGFADGARDGGPAGTDEEGFEDAVESPAAPQAAPAPDAAPDAAPEVEDADDEGDSDRRRGPFLRRLFGAAEDGFDAIKPLAGIGIGGQAPRAETDDREASADTDEAPASTRPVRLEIPDVPQVMPDRRVFFPGGAEGAKVHKSRLERE
jgi:type IV pilus assembly protein PilQ